MLKQKEDVLLMVKHVRYKKVDGTLYVNSGRVAWRNQTSDSFRISANFEDIRVQRISPDQKEKVQLQLLMHNGESFTFEFSDPTGRDKQLEMRNSVKTMLQNILPKFKDKAQAELREKFCLLESNPDILSLYKELVVSGILTSEEFWARPELCKSVNLNFSNDSKSLQQSPKKSSPIDIPLGVTTNPARSMQVSLNNSCQISRSFQVVDYPQITGVSSSLLSDIKPEADGANGIVYNLTHETMDSIFRAYPTVKKRHLELVPDKLSETDFWVKFFQSHYFHRDRVQLSKEDIFSDCVRMDEKYLFSDLRCLKYRRLNSHLDVSSLDDHDIGAGYGCEELLKSLPQKTNSVAENNIGDSQRGNLSANQLLLRRFNNHSILVLKSLDVSGGKAGAMTSSTTKDTLHSDHLKNRIYTKELSNDEDVSTRTFDLSNVNDYLEGPASLLLQNKSHSHSKPFNHGTSDLCKKAMIECSAFVDSTYKTGKVNCPVLISSVEAQLALADISPGGCLVGAKSVDEFSKSSVSHGAATSTNTNHSTFMNSDQCRDFALLYSSASELLRHFWACFPVSSVQLAEKLDRIAASLSRFRTHKLVPFASSFLTQSKLETSSEDVSKRSDQTAGGYRPVSHLESMLDCAQEKYKLWKACRT